MSAAVRRLHVEKVRGTPGSVPMKVDACGLSADACELSGEHTSRSGVAVASAGARQDWPHPLADDAPVARHSADH